jgi:hypothetical protein
MGLTQRVSIRPDCVGSVTSLSHPTDTCHAARWRPPRQSSALLPNVPATSTLLSPALPSPAKDGRNPTGHRGPLNRPARGPATDGRNPTSQPLHQKCGYPNQATLPQVPFFHPVHAPGLVIHRGTSSPSLAFPLPLPPLRPPAPNPVIEAGVRVGIMNVGGNNAYFIVMVPTHLSHTYNRKGHRSSHKTCM